MTTYQQGVGQLDPGMDCVKAAPSASHLCAVNPDGAEHLTRPDLQPVVAFLFARVKGLDLNDCKNACIQGSPDLVLQATDCEVVEHRAQNVFQDARELGYKTRQGRLLHLAWLQIRRH